ncbi:MAG: hypothetical protein DRI88_07290 [Bacteroidetes bacterium]|nr:MAG: hypothetical protein DRI88_07290 [Bacteroidota bacterium]
MEQKKILLFADDPDLLFAYKTILTDNGYTVSTATNASEVETLLQLSSYKLALIDSIKESKYGGCDVFKNIKKIKPEIPVISLILCNIITTDIPEDDCSQADIFIEKPVIAKELTEAINYLLSKDVE